MDMQHVGDDSDDLRAQPPCPDQLDTLTSPRATSGPKGADLCKSRKSNDTKKSRDS
jgi:hypothetical protein